MVTAFISSLGPGLLVSALNVRYRDFRFVLPFMIQFGLYLCPVGFSSSIIREKFGESIFLLYSINPMVGVIDGFRWAILGQPTTLDLSGFLVSMISASLLLTAGVRHFRKIERTFADII